MIQHEGKTLLTTKEAHTVLNCSIEALRQMLYRKKFKKKRIGNRIYLYNAEVLEYFPKRKRLPAFEDSGIKEKCYSFDHVCGLLNYSPAYLKTLIKSGRLEGYCTAEGQILIPEQSLNKYVGVSDEAKDI